MQPPTPAPTETRAHRLYQLLTYRYMQQLTQEETAERLHITERHVRREQNDAVGVLAQLLWQQIIPAEQTIAQEPSATISVTPAEHPTSAWSTQLRQELTTLQLHPPESAADIGEVLRGVGSCYSPSSTMPALNCA